MLDFRLLGHLAAMDLLEAMLKMDKLSLFGIPMVGIVDLMSGIGTIPWMARHSKLQTLTAYRTWEDLWHLLVAGVDAGHVKRYSKWGPWIVFVGACLDT